ncbi:MAG: ISKra4 family transposase [Gammaproteobacteria bacterium]
MILSQEQALLKGQQEFQQVAAFVAQASAKGQPIHEVERGLFQQLMKLGHVMLEGFVQSQGSGDLGSTLEHQGQTLRRLEQMHDRRYVSIFGELIITRHVYGTRETQKHEGVPLDARLNLPDSEFSYVLQDWDQHLCVKGPYGEARETVQEILGLGQSVRSLETMNLSMAQQVESFHQCQPAPPAEEEGSILVMTADGKGVPMRKEEMAKTGRRKRGDKANKKRMACVGSVYTIEPFVRTADDIVDEVMRKESQENRPVPQHKQVRAELTGPIGGVEVNGKARIFAWFQQQVAARNPNWTKPVVCLMDGERALWKMLCNYLTGIICILDLFHVMERLWQAAYCFCPEGSDEAKQFVSQRLYKILEGNVGYVIGGLKQMATKQQLKGAKLKQLESAIGYLHNNRKLMRYHKYLAAGYPIGSGVAEGACRHLVKDRMERTGMRWQVPSAQAMLDLRALHVSEQWQEFQSYRIDAETSRVYPYQGEVTAQWPIAA